MRGGKGKSRFALPAGLERSGQKRRPVRVADAIRTELAALLVKKIRDPRLSGIIFTAVEVSDDLGHARVMYSILGDDDQADVARGLESCKGFMRSTLARTLELRHVPELDFRHDLSSRRQAEMEQLLKEIAEEDGNS